MFQFGRVTKVLSAKDKDITSSDNLTVAVLEMWDEVIITAAVHPAIQEKVKSGDFVVTEINPISQNMNRQTVVKIVAGKNGDDIWKSYRKMFMKRNPQAQDDAPIAIDLPRGMIR